jgi:hypothetical protein
MWHRIESTHYQGLYVWLMLRFSIKFLVMLDVFLSTTSSTFLFAEGLKLDVAIGRVGSSLGSGRMNRVSLIFWKKSGRVRVGSDQVNLHIVFFQIFDRFRLDWKSFGLRSGRISLIFFKIQVGSGLDSDEFLESDRILSPLIKTSIYWYSIIHWSWSYVMFPRPSNQQKKKGLIGNFWQVHTSLWPSNLTQCLFFYLTLFFSCLSLITISYFFHLDMVWPYVYFSLII